MNRKVMPGMIILACTAAVVLSRLENARAAAYGSSEKKSTLIVERLQDTRIDRSPYLPIKIRYTGKEDLDQIEVRVYVLLVKGQKSAVIKGARSLSEVTTGRLDVTGHIPKRYEKQFGRLRAKRAEVWYKGKLMHALTDPKPKKGYTWWKEDADGKRKVIPALEILELDIRELKRRLKDND